MIIHFFHITWLIKQLLKCVQKRVFCSASIFAKHPFLSPLLFTQYPTLKHQNSTKNTTFSFKNSLVFLNRNSQLFARFKFLKYLQGFAYICMFRVIDSCLRNKMFAKVQNTTTQRGQKLARTRVFKM